MIVPGKYKLNSTQYLESYKKILLLRRFEEKCGQLYGMGLIGGFCHLYIGQEAIITGIDLVKQAGDNTITSYRDHAHIISAGTEAKYVLAELMGKETGCSKGKGGSMHMFDVQNKFYGGHGIVGAQVPIGTGLAFAEKYRNTDNVCFTFLGDGAVNQGQVYEAFNIAALWHLPIIYIIENNQYSMGTSVARSTFMTDLYKKGESFGITGFKVNGMSLESVYDYARQAAEFTRNGGGPIILEMDCYRYRGHSMSDPAKYRSKEEVDIYKEQDPLSRVKDIILDNKYASEQQLKEIDKEVKDIIAEAVEFSESSALPDEKELYTNIYVVNE
ncbi:pyruvate dehydrogenase (acetyl-transferring) E1 component subunit alpha [Rickettsia endosymbiont of Culicoides newsteadi]|uniref:pyruvate dehydrogenase (acetyl-transferring) E1 component subunit alpha n=1 Tax=Rickettsia endosymbiont of Culicoides newsteadi TaxID=1961830 RepID=UPI000B9C2431|nr:pyruvate dehydrogenase (acetyl-transferring) E1 component subunit alpha [Rickettsia endosymbiont of Culicoides newsteadi]OZG32482.1 pyruvate dehydrogenase E1 component subunit alpha [Rickettsia endosymbiont of Culicoides newsteadi]